MLERYLLIYGIEIQNDENIPVKISDCYEIF